MLKRLLVCLLVISSLPAASTALAETSGGGSTVSSEHPLSFASRRDAFVRGRGVGIGVRANVAYAGDDSLVLGGGGFVLRVVLSPRFALETTIDGRFAEGETDVPVGLSGLIFLGRRWHVQPYVLFGLDVNMVFPEIEDTSLYYMGGHAGLGVEFLVGRYIGITVDARAFIEGNLDPGASGDREYGVAFNTGINLYLPGNGRR